jgi:starch synthase
MFDTALANEIYAASDFSLVPSLYEPCGLVQMISMWYGAIPIVHNVGGLKDSVKNGVNGFVFAPYGSGRLLDAVNRALKIYFSSDKNIMVRNCLKTDFSWKNSAQEYKLLYEKVINLKKEGF